MILERFTEQEIEQIKKELGFFEYPTQKSVVLMRHKEKLADIIPECGRQGKTRCMKKQLYDRAHNQIMIGLVKFCDIVLKNYTTEKGIVECSKEIPLELQERYLKMIDELLEIGRKYKKGAE